MIQQHPSMPRALKDTACDLIAQLLSPLVEGLPQIPPGPPERTATKPALTEGGRLTVPAPAGLDYQLQEDPSLSTLLGGAS